MNKDKLLSLLIGIGAVILLLGIIWFVFFTDTIVGAEAKQEDKVYWCHTEPNGNQQTLHLPLSALQNAGHVNASGNPLHAGDHAGVCIEPSVIPSITPDLSVSPTAGPSATLTPTVTPNPCYELEDGSNFRIINDEVEPCLTPTPEPTAQPSATPTTVPANTPNTGDGKSDGMSDGKSSCPECTKYTNESGIPLINQTINK